MTRELDLDALRTGIATLIGGIDSEVNTYGGYVPTTPIIPPAVVVTPDVEYVVLEGTLGEPVSVVNFVLRIYASSSVDGQKFLSRLLSVGATQVDSLYGVLNNQRVAGAVLEVGGALIDEVPIDTESNTVFQQASVPLVAHVAD